jgi:hypothetical protein
LDAPVAGAIEKSVAAPDSATDCGLPGALSVIVTAAIRLPAAVGLNVTLIEQLPPAATLAPQLSVLLKSPALAPPSTRLLILSAPFPLSVRVTLCGLLLEPATWLEKDRLLLDRLTAAAVTEPVPDSATDCGLPAALSVIVTAAVRLPAAVGVKVTLMVQLPPAATLAPHVLLCAKSPAFIPVTPMLDIVSELPPLLLSVTVCAALALPTD